MWCRCAAHEGLRFKVYILRSADWLKISAKRFMLHVRNVQNSKRTSRRKWTWNSWKVRSAERTKKRSTFNWVSGCFRRATFTAHSLPALRQRNSFPFSDKNSLRRRKIRPLQSECSLLWDVFHRLLCRGEFRCKKRPLCQRLYYPIWLSTTERSSQL